ncbi:MAG TPA: glycine zipper 2TM domain-containing protein [Burkholderiaceae bacterium]
MPKSTSLSALLLAATVATAIQAAPAKPSKSELAGLCKGCAWVSEVHTETRQGKASGVGVVGGAVLGGLLGNQIGGGTGKKIATVGGAVAGGYAGNAIEKNAKKYQVWVVHLVNKDGSQRVHEQGANPNLKVGDQVALENGLLQRR